MATVAAVDSQVDLDIQRVNPVIGAWVRNFDIAADNQSKAAALSRALADHGVLFFDFGRVPDGEEYTRFASLFGNVQAVFGQKVKEQDENSVPLIDAERMPIKDYLTNWWHSDGGPLDVPPLAAILTAFEAPELGGDTMFSSAYAAYDALSPAMQSLFDNLTILNNNKRTPFLEPKEKVHPAVVRNPLNGRKCLYFNPIYTERFVELTEKENESLRTFLLDHINTPEFHCRLTWKEGYCAVWHQQATWHRAVDGFIGHRKLKRLTVDGAPLLRVNS